MISRSHVVLLAALAFGALLLAYFHASAASSLVRAALVPSTGVERHAETTQEPKRDLPSGKVILERNLFDSTTGSLPKPSAPKAAPPEPVDPLQAPRCTGIRVVATTQSGNPLDSTAMVRAAGEPRAFLRRVGDQVGNGRIAFIGSNPVEYGPAVWLEAEDGLCQTVLFDQPALAAALPPSPRPTEAAPRSAQAKRGASTLPQELAAKIARSGPTSYRIDRAAFETILRNATSLLRSVRVRAAKADGRVIGFAIRNVAPHSLLDTVGLKSGDLLRSVNGYDLTGPAEALQAYAKLRVASTIRVEATRGGKPLELEYRIQ